jgi:hypothetical protein
MAHNITVDGRQRRKKQRHQEAEEKLRAFPYHDFILWGLTS